MDVQRDLITSTHKEKDRIMESCSDMVKSIRQSATVDQLSKLNVEELRHVIGHFIQNMPRDFETKAVTSIIDEMKVGMGEVHTHLEKQQELFQARDNIISTAQIMESSGTHSAFESAWNELKAQVHNFSSLVNSQPFSTKNREAIFKSLGPQTTKTIRSLESRRDIFKAESDLARSFLEKAMILPSTPDSQDKPADPLEAFL